MSINEEWRLRPAMIFIHIDTVGDDCFSIRRAILTVNE